MNVGRLRLPRTPLTPLFFRSTCKRRRPSTFRSATKPLRLITGWRCRAPATSTPRPPRFNQSGTLACRRTSQRLRRWVIGRDRRDCALNCFVLTQAIIRTSDGRPLSILQLNVHPQPPTVDQTLRFYNPEQSFFKKCIRLPPFDPACRDRK